MQTESLKKIGLKDEEIVVYLYLLTKNEAKASAIIKKTALKRGTVYNVLTSLIAKGLAEANTETKVARWRVTHPASLLALLEKQESEFNEGKETLATTIPDLVSQYNLANERPGVRFFEGIAGNHQLYEDILQVNKDYYLIRPVYESTYKDQVKPIFKKFMHKRIAKKLRVRALTPADDKHATEEGRREQEKKDSSILFDRTWVDTKLYNAPVEIDVYGDRVGIISYGKEFIGTIIQSPQISSAFKQIFELARLGAKVRGLHYFDK